MFCKRSKNADTGANFQNGDTRFFRNYHFPDRSQSAKENEGGGLNDSIWAVIASVVKNYNLSPDYVLYDISYINITMLNLVLPTYDKKKKESEFDSSKDANVPGRFNKNQEEVIVRKR